MFLSRAENKELLAKCCTDYTRKILQNRPRENVFQWTKWYYLLPHDFLSDSVPRDCRCAELNSSQEKTDTHMHDIHLAKIFLHVLT